MIRRFVLLCAVLVAPTLAAAAERPFKASLTGNAHLSPTPDPTVLRNDETGSGNATHLGKFQWVSVEFADFDAIPGGVAVTGVFTMTAANGDEVHGTYMTVGTFADATTLVIHGTFQITGGTGRFVGATGGGDLDANAYLSPGLPFDGRLNGTINY